MAVVVETSEQDDRSYRYLEMPNSLRVLLISDPETDKAAAAMDVKVGTYSDPEKVQGLAHFLEHMLFLGTEKYPDENSYSAFLSANAGHSNAFTDTEDTNFFFDVGSEHLREALDRFAQFFIAPLFTESATERETNAVDSENAKNLQSDAWRLMQLNKSLARPDHPFSKFGTGNLETLSTGPKAESIDVREELLKFHRDHYSANRMALVVLGREPLETLSEWVLESFAAVQNTSLEKLCFPGEPYGPSQLCKRLEVVPVKDMRVVEICWPLPPVQDLYRAKPTRYLSHLLGHEAGGSVLSLLKARGWANELSAGLSRSLSDWSSFNVSVELTPEGLEHPDEVVLCVFQYIALLREKGPQEWIWAESRDIAAANFRFRSQSQPMGYVSSLAGNVHSFAAEHIVSGASLIFDYDASAITDLLAKLVPENMVVCIVAKKFSETADSRERWYDTAYRLSALTAEEVSKFAAPPPEPKLHLPEPNTLIATDFSMRSAPSDHACLPSLIVCTAQLSLWFKYDDVFARPKANLLINCLSSVAYESPVAAVLTQLFVMMVRGEQAGARASRGSDALCPCVSRLRQIKEQTNEFAYQADLAGLYYDINNVRKGIELSISGYNEKLPVLLEKVVAACARPEFEPSVFARLKDRLEQQLTNYQFKQPYQHAMTSMVMCLEEPRWSPIEKLAALEPVTLEDLRAFVPRLLGHLAFEALAHGNLTEAEAIQMLETVRETLGAKELLASTAPESAHVVVLPAGTVVVHSFAELNEENLNSAIEMIFVIGPEDVGESARLDLLMHLTKEPCFNELRTQEQLGYLVFSGVMQLGDYVNAARFIIQSEPRDPAHLDARIEAFLARLRTKIANLTDDELSDNIQAVVTQKLEKPKNLNEESLKYWEEINSGGLMFDRRETSAAEVQKLSRADVLAFFDKFIASEAPERRKIAVHCFATNKWATAFDAASPAPAGATDATATSEAETVTASETTAPTSPAADSEVAPSVPAPIISVSDPRTFRREQAVYPLRPKATRRTR